MRTSSILALSTLMLAPCSCGGGGGDGVSLVVDPDPTRQLLAECTAVGVRDYSKLADAVMALLDAIDSPAAPPPGVIFEPTTGAFTLELDLDGDGSPDTLVDGSMLAPFTQLDDGFDLGESFGFELSSIGSVNVTGQLSLAFFDGSVVDPYYQVQGNLQFTDGSPCAFGATSMNVTQFFREGEREAIGAIDFMVLNGGGQLQGVISLVPSEDAIVNGDDGVATMHFYVDSISFLPYIE